MSKRDLSPDFLNAMREKLDSGRTKGRVGWDRKWRNTRFSGDPENILFSCLQAEIIELAIALHDKDKKAIRHEAADVANFAMMLADITKSLEADEVLEE